jgi:hypothetical protein
MRQLERARVAVGLLIASLAAGVAAQTPPFATIIAPSSNDILQAGTAFIVKWTPSTAFAGGAALSLLGGPSEDSFLELGDLGCQ